MTVSENNIGYVLYLHLHIPAPKWPTQDVTSAEPAPGDPDVPLPCPSPSSSIPRGLVLCAGAFFPPGSPQKFLHLLYKVCQGGSASASHWSPFYFLALDCLHGVGVGGSREQAVSVSVPPTALTLPAESSEPVTPSGPPHRWPRAPEVKVVTFGTTISWQATWGTGIAPPTLHRAWVLAVTFPEHCKSLSSPSLVGLGW